MCALQVAGQSDYGKNWAENLEGVAARPLRAPPRRAEARRTAKWLGAHASLWLADASLTATSHLADTRLWLADASLTAKAHTAPARLLLTDASLTETELHET